MAIIEENIRGRLGSYTLEIYGTGPEESPIDAKLESDVVLRYGDIDRSPAKQVLKSYAQLSFVDPQLTLHGKFRGGFGKEDFHVVIQGQNIDWRGLVKEESRTVPFSQKTQVERTVLNVYGGVTGGRISEPRTGQFVNRGYSLKEVLRQLTIKDLQANDLDDRLFISSDVELDRHGPIGSGGPFETTHEVGAVGTLARPINMYQNDSVYEAYKGFNILGKEVLYRSLSEGAVVHNSVRNHGTSVNGVSKLDEDENFESDNRDRFVNTVDGFIIEEGRSGLKDLEKLGRISVSIGKEDNLGIPGARYATNEDPDYVEWDEAREIGSYPQQFFGTDKTKQFRVGVGREDQSVGETVSLYLGEIDPTKALGILVEWDLGIVGTTSTNEVELSYRGNSGKTFTADPENESAIIGARTEKLIDPLIEFSGSFTMLVKVRYLGQNDNVVETLKSTIDKEGVEDIEIDSPSQPLISFVGIENGEEAYRGVTIRKETGDPGERMYAVSNKDNENVINEFKFESRWDTWSLKYLRRKKVTANNTFLNDIGLKYDGSAVYVLDVGEAVREYTLSTPFDVSTASLKRSEDISPQDTGHVGLFFKPDGTKFYTVGSQNTNLYEYDLSTAWDISTASFNQSADVSGNEGDPLSVWIGDQGSKLYLVGDFDGLHEYTLSTAWDISSKSHDNNQKLSEIANPHGVSLKTDGSKIYINGFEKIYEYDFGTDWDTTTLDRVSTTRIGGPSDLVEAKRIRQSSTGIENVQPFLFRSAIEANHRPFGTQTARGRILGLYGPEYVHEVVEGGESTYFVPTGLKCNLTTGVTDAALVEVPAHALA